MRNIRTRVLVTGGAGFIGSHLCEALLGRGYEVLCVDNYFTGSRENVSPLLTNPHFELLRHDITFPLYVEVGQIYNLACPASPCTTSTIRSNGQNQRCRRDQRAGAGQARQGAVVQASTSEVYGDPQSIRSRNYWGTSIPLAPGPVMTKASAARRRCFSTTTGNTARHPGSAHLQHLRSKDDAARRPRGLQLHRAGLAREASRSMAMASKRGRFAT